MRVSRVPRDERGFVLVTVLMGIALLASIAATLMISSRTDVLATTSLVDLARAEAAADAGVALAILNIVAAPEQPPAQGETHCRFEDFMLAISVVDEGGKIDINAAPPAMLSALIEGVVGDSRRAHELSQLISDFADADDMDRLGSSSELSVYSGIKGPTPKNLWFATIDELEQVPGLTQELADGRALFEHLRPFVTVWSRRAGFDPNVAPPGLADLIALTKGGIPADGGLPTEARYFTITVASQSKSGARFTREVTIERDSNVREGYRLRNFVSRPFDKHRQASWSDVEQPCLVHG